MSSFKIGNSKFSRFVNGKGFYIALALCLVAIGTATYIAVNNSTGIVSSIKSGYGVSSGSKAASSIPNWDASSSAKEANTTVSGVHSSSRNASSTASSSQAAASSTEPKKSSGTAKLVYTMPVSGSVTTAYSGDNPVFDKTMGDWRVHDGVDLSATEGTPVKACAAGTVSDVKVDDMLGQEVIIDHGNGIKSIYANLASQVTVKKGQQVDVGDTLGAIGETATAEIAITPHLHFEITKSGTDVDPLAMISGEN